MLVQPDQITGQVTYTFFDIRSVLLLTTVQAAAGPCLGHQEGLPGLP